ncbi:hypothetical protein V8F20_007884 [Naviculisporaceae sp. PSN 640]
MADRDIYIRYKYETSRILYWILQTSNQITKSSASPPETDVSLEKEARRALNTSGQVTVSGLVALTRLISRHVDKTPLVILRLFRSVIDGRTSMHARFQQLAAQTSDPDVIKSNTSHKLFIDALQEAYDFLGGDDALKSTAGTQLDPPFSSVESKDDIDQLLLTNKFDKLHVQGASGSSSDSGEHLKPSGPAAGPRRQTKPGKGKKTKRAKKSKKTHKADVESVPLESYGIIRNAEDMAADYLMAVYDVFQQVMTIRITMQQIWREVAYDGLHTAVAGAVSHIAVGMVQRSGAAVFVDFPGRDSFESMLKAITRGDVEKGEGRFVFERHLFEQMQGDEQDEDVRFPGWRAPKVVQTIIDVNEHMLGHTYRALVDFIIDYQKNRSGKPTKKMLAQLKNWDPLFQLEAPDVTDEQRVQWRRCYTIKWLYDLVNIYSSAVQDKEEHVLEDVDWSAQGPCGRVQRIFGLEELAGVVTALAMQKPGTEFSQRILPHHVFQLQLVIDSFAVSRGWSLSILWGSRLVAPPQGFSPRRDIDLFLDRENKRGFHGFLTNAHVLEELLGQEGREASTQGYNKEIIEMVRSMRVEFRDWLGQTGQKDGLNQIPPSRFSKTNPEGLWERSPMLCGTGLVEALIMASQLGLRVWDRVPEVTSLVHLHNMLHKQGFIPQAIGLLDRMQDVDMFLGCFYENSAIPGPTSDYDKALLHHRLTKAAFLKSQRGRERQTAEGAARLDIMSPHLNTAFTVKSGLLVYHQARWDPERISVADVSRDSMLMYVRLAGTSRVIDPVTGKLQVEDTELVRQLVGPEEGEGADERSKQLHGLARTILSPDYVKTAYPGIPDQVLKQAQETRSGYQVSGSTQPDKQSIPGRKFSDDILLDILKQDMVRDICGHRPLSGLNYLSVAAWTKKVYAEMEVMLKDRGFDMYFQAYQSAEARRRTLTQKRIKLVCEACASDDHDALVAITEILEKHRAEFKDHMYWDDAIDDRMLLQPGTESGGS